MFPPTGPGVTDSSNTGSAARVPIPPIAAEGRAVYDEAARAPGDRSLSHPERRNRLSLVRRNFGDDLFFTVIQDVPVLDAATGQMVTFADYMLDLAGTFVSHPEAPITFDPVGAATQIYFSPTEDTVRRMTGIGLADEQVRKYSAMYQGGERAPKTAEDTSRPAVSPGTADGPRQDTSASTPAFISRDPELRAAYNEAREILTNRNETEESRRAKVQLMQQNLGQETMTLLLRYVPVVDLESGNVQSFDDYMRGVASSYHPGQGSPMDRDPVGAAMTMFFDPHCRDCRDNHRYRPFPS